MLVGVRAKNAMSVLLRDSAPHVNRALFGDDEVGPLLSLPHWDEWGQNSLCVPPRVAKTCVVRPVFAWMQGSWGQQI